MIRSSEHVFVAGLYLIKTPEELCLLLMVKGIRMADIGEGLFPLKGWENDLVLRLKSAQTSILTNPTTSALANLEPSSG